MLRGAAAAVALLSFLLAASSHGSVHAGHKWGNHACAACEALEYIGHSNCTLIDGLCDLVPLATGGCVASGCLLYTSPSPRDS